MLINDCHIHSYFSGDCNEEIDKIIENAIRLKMKNITITDHFEYDVVGMTDRWRIDLDKYCKTILEYREKYKSKIDIRLGVEVGIQPHTREFLEKQISSHPFDFVIASTHALGRKDISANRFYEFMSKSELQKYYFETVLHNVKNYNNFDVYGHIDFITRKGGENYRGVNFYENEELITEILSTLIAKNKGIEINTSGFRYGENRVYPCYEILKRYIDLGGKIITIGSDSHVANYLGMDFEYAYEMLKDLGINYICSFKNRKPIFEKITK